MSSQEGSTQGLVASADNEVEIRIISAQETYPLRREVLRPSVDVLRFEDDLSSSAIHLGAFTKNKLVGIVSAFQEDFHDEEKDGERACHDGGNVQWRIRGFAISTQMQKKGLGSKLLGACVHHVRERGGRMLWTRARVTAAQFYSKQGFKETGRTFNLEGVGSVHLMYRYV